MPLGPFKSLFLFKKYLKNFCLNKDPFFYAIYSKKLKKYSGLASYLRIKPEIGTIEVGWITYAPNLQKTVEATEAMYLMMRNIFDVLGYRRYEWKCDNLNKRSKKSAVRFGFKYEGLFRQATIYKKRNRDTAWFAIIDKEWKKLKYGFQRYLKPSNFDKDYTQLKKLKLKFK
jgi:RimJ/RimL family protein N-acetyltransferase